MVRGLASAREFLEYVLPVSGPYCICHSNPKPYGYTQRTAADLDEAAAIAEQFNREGKNAFFAVGALIDPSLDKGLRAGENIRALRSYILDIDVGDIGHESPQYASFEEAYKALYDFCQATKLPRPTVINSGGGLHVYWTLTDEVPEAEWERYGERLKQLAIAHNLRIDPGRTADSSSVLRVMGVHNYKYTPPVLITPICISSHHTPDQIHALLQNGAEPAPNKFLGGGAPIAGLGTNTKREYEKTELDFKLMLEQCPQFRDVALNQQGQPEPRWYKAIMLCTQMRNGRKAAHLISNQDSRYTETDTNEKFDQASAYGPSTCAEWEKWDLAAGRPNICASCKHHGKLTSPAQVAHYFEKAPTPAVTEQTPLVTQEFVEPPLPYRRTTKGIVIRMENKDGVDEDRVICPYDMYPVKLRYNEATKLEEDVQWCINIPKRGWTLVDLPQGIAQMQLHSTLAKRGIYFDAKYTPQMGQFMTAYMRELQARIKTEHAFAKYGWRDDGGFALGDVLYKADGTHESHSASGDLIAATHDGIMQRGTFEAWKKAIAFYNQPGMEAYRVFLYSAFGSVFYHMSGHKSTSICATGLPGIGKSTIMEACASVWGAPDRLIRRGGKHGTTRAALEGIAHGLHSLPLMLDEISHADPKEMAEFIFNYSAGGGKARAKATGGVRTDTASWANLLMVNTNNDEYDRFMITNRDNSAHMLRLVQLPFRRVPGITKEDADVIKRQILANYGFAGPVFVAAITPHYEKLRKRMERYDREVSAAVNATSDERFWCAWVASARLGGEVAAALGLLEGFPVLADVAWMYDLVKQLRQQVVDKLPSALDLLSEFMDASIDGTLRLSTSAGKINNIVHEPRGELIVRHDMDNGEVVIAVNAFHTFCNKQQVNYTRIIDELLRQRIVTHASTPRTLGAGTQWTAGRVRSIVLNLKTIPVQQPTLAYINPNPPAGKTGTI